MFAEVSQVIQVEWQALAAFGATVGAAIVGAAKIIATQLKHNAEKASADMAGRHRENREDAIEARKENRELSGAILSIQSRTVQTLAETQAEIRALLDRLPAGECEAEPGSKSHTPFGPKNKGK
jgi:hypothetical protein